jgi:hypothetical protein
MVCTNEQIWQVLWTFGDLGTGIAVKIERVPRIVPPVHTKYRDDRDRLM